MLTISILFFLALQLKHFIIDFVLQTPYMYLNKGTINHPGGHLHAGLHALITFYIFFLFMPSTLILFYVCLLEYVWHYITDYSKVNICKKYNWKADNSEEFWYAMGADQLSHQLCYIVMVFLLLGNYV